MTATPPSAEGAAPSAGGDASSAAGTASAVPIPAARPPVYRRLDGGEILKTASLLTRRVGERFPDSNLARVCAELEGVVAETDRRCRWIARPMVPLRVAIALLGLLIVAVLALSLASLEVRPGELVLTELIQVLESGINDVVLIGLAVAFLITVEGRIKRAKALRALHELRALAHVIDMHQLTKDPERILGGGEGGDTPSSPRRTLSPFQLVRYLDYSSEMLAVIGKAAALYAQRLADPVVLASVNEIEQLATNLSQKIWQKITTVEVYRERQGA
jgi:hypothetical protein